jgi:hypothetical protein
MAWQIVKNPETSKYQIFSSIVDAFLLDDEFTKEELLEFFQHERGKQGVESAEKIIKELDQGIKPYGKLTMTFEEAKMWDAHQASHGPKNRQPDTCKICKEILDEEERDRKKTSTTS